MKKTFVIYLRKDETEVCLIIDAKNRKRLATMLKGKIRTGYIVLSIDRVTNAMQRKQKAYTKKFKKNLDNM